MASVHSLTTAPINVYSKTYWTSFIAAVNEEAAFELGLHDRINPEAIRQSTREGWSASLFTPNILRHTDVYVDRSTNIDLSSHTDTHVHYHHEDSSPARELSVEEQEAKRKQQEEDSLQKYKWLGPFVGTVGAFFSAYTWRGYQRCKATYDHTHEVQRQLRFHIFDNMTPLKDTLDRIVTLKLAVDNIRYKILKRYFWASAGVLVGGGLLTLGAYTRQPRLIPWGQIALAVAAIWAAASAGFHWQDNKDIKSLYTSIALEPERLADHALYQLYNYYQEGMTLHPQYVQNRFYSVPPGGYEPYQPFFMGIPVPQDPPPSFVDGYSPAARYEAAPSAPYLYSDQLDT